MPLFFDTIKTRYFLQLCSGDKLFAEDSECGVHNFH